MSSNLAVVLLCLCFLHPCRHQWAQPPKDMWDRLPWPGWSADLQTHHLTRWGINADEATTLSLLAACLIIKNDWAIVFSQIDWSLQELVVGLYSCDCRQCVNLFYEVGRPIKWPINQLYFMWDVLSALCLFSLFLGFLQRGEVCFQL